MAEQIAYLEAVVGADITGFRRGMQTVRNDLGILSDTIGGIGKLGRTLSFAVTAPLLGFGIAAAKAATEFDASMRNVNSIAQLTEQQFSALSARALEFGKTIRDGPQAAAEALYTVFSAGITDPDKAFDVMTVSVKTAEAGLADLNTTVGVVSASVLAYSNAGLTAARAGDILTRTVALGVGEMNNFARALPYVTPIAAAAGIAFEDVGASLAYLTQQGTPANTAARQLAQAISSIVKPSDGMAAALQRLGVNGIDGLLDKYGNLKDALIALRGTTDGSLESISKLFGNMLAGRAVNALTNDVDRLNGVWAEFMGGIEGATDLARAEQLKSFAAQFDLMKSAASGLAITIGNVLLPMLTPLVTRITELFNTLSSSDPKLLQIATSFGIVAAAAGPLLWLFASLLSPIGLLAGASAGLAAAIAVDWGGIRTSIEDTVNQSFPAVQRLMDIVSQFFGILFADEQVMSEGFFSVDTPADSIPVNITGNLWDSWTGSLKEQFPDRNSFIQMATEALQEQHGLTPYQIPVGGIELALGGSSSSGASDDMYAQAMGFNRDPKDITSTLGERLSTAITMALPQVQTAFMDLFSQAKEYVVSTVFPTLDTLAGDLLNTIANVFSGGLAIGKQGKSPVYDAIRNLLGGGLSDAAADMTSLVDKHFPKVSDGLSWLVTSIGSWLINEGIPAASRSIGYFVGQLGGLIGQGLAAIPAMLTDGDKTGSLLAGFTETIGQPFEQGFNDAMTDLNITNPGDQLVTSIAGWIGLVLATKLAASLITTGVASTVGSILTSVIGSASIGSAGGTVAKAGGGLAFKIGKFIGGSFTAATSTIGLALSGVMAAVLTAAYILDPTIRAQIDEMGKSIADALFGQGWTDTARTNIQSALTPILEPFLRPFAELQAGQGPLQDVINNVTGQGQSEDMVHETLPILNGNPNKPRSSADAMMQSGLSDLYASGMYTIPNTSEQGYGSKMYMMGAQAAVDGALAMPGGVNPLTTLVQDLLPEGPAGTAIAAFVTTGLGAFQNLQDGIPLKTDAIVAGLSIFGVNAITALTPLKEYMDQILSAFSALGMLNGMQAITPVVPDVLPSTTITSGGTYTPEAPGQTNIVINGVNNVSDVMHELSRQGIRLQDLRK